MVPSHVKWLILVIASIGFAFDIYELLMLPLILRRCGIDPATSSAPFVATLVDVTGLIIYFSFAMLLMRGTLL